MYPHTASVAWRVITSRKIPAMVTAARARTARFGVPVRWSTPAKYPGNSPSRARVNITRALQFVNATITAKYPRATPRSTK
jgi:hypothetical protein